MVIENKKNMEMEVGSESQDSWRTTLYKLHIHPALGPWHKILEIRLYHN